MRGESGERKLELSFREVSSPAVKILTISCFKECDLMQALFVNTVILFLLVNSLSSFNKFRQFLNAPQPIIYAL